MSDYTDYTTTYTYYTNAQGLLSGLAGLSGSGALGTVSGGASSRVASGTIDTGAYSLGMAASIVPDAEWEAQREALLTYQSQVKVSYGVSKPAGIFVAEHKPVEPEPVKPLITVDPDESWYEPRAE